MKTVLSHIVYGYKSMLGCKTLENKNGVLWSQARMKIEMRLRYHLVI